MNYYTDYFFQNLVLPSILVTNGVSKSKGMIGGTSTASSSCTYYRVYI